MGFDKVSEHLCHTERQIHFIYKYLQKYFFYSNLYEIKI